MFSEGKIFQAVVGGCSCLPREAGKLIHLVVKQIALGRGWGWGGEVAPGRFNPAHRPGEHQSKKFASSFFDAAQGGNCERFRWICAHFLIRFYDVEF